MILKINANIFCKKNCFKDLKNQLFKLNLKQPLILCDEVFSKDKYVTSILKKFRNVKFLKFKNEPTYEDLDILKAKLKNKNNIDSIVGIGGGSCIDMAKGLALMIKNLGPSINYMGFPKKIKKPLPVVAIPTTVSTGSEVIYNAVFTSKNKKIKLGINSDLNYPVLALVDSKLIKKAPKYIIIQSAIASLIRSIETFTSPDSNIITKIFAKQSFEFLFETLLNLKALNEKSIQQLQWGCIFSMFALSNSSSGPCGVINYFLSVNYNIPQALAYNFTWIEFFKKNIKKGFTDYSELINKKNSRKLKLNYLSNGLKKIIKMNEKKIQSAKKKIKFDNKFELKIYNQFKKFNFSPMKKNPIYLSDEDLKQIIKNIKF